MELDLEVWESTKEEIGEVSELRLAVVDHSHRDIFIDTIIREQGNNLVSILRGPGDSPRFEEAFQMRDCHSPLLSSPCMGKERLGEVKTYSSVHPALHVW